MSKRKTIIDALREMLAQIDGGEIEASAVHRAYLAGALAAFEIDEQLE